MLVKVKVFSGSKKNKIVEKDGLEIHVKENPIQNKANEQSIKMLTKHFNISEKQVKLIKGFKQKNKVFKIHVETKT